MTTPQFILPFIVQKVEGDEGLAFVTDSGDMDTVRCITEEMPLEEAQWLCDRLNGPTTEARAALADAIEEVAKWHERQAFDVESEHPGVQGSKSQKRRKRFHNESAAALRTLPAAQPTGMDSRAEFEKWAVTEEAGRLDITPERNYYTGAAFDYIHVSTRVSWRAWQAARQPAAVPEALSSQQAEGWVLVPREPTPEMCRVNGRTIQEVWTAMLSAAPSAPTGERAAGLTLTEDERKTVRWVTEACELPAVSLATRPVRNLLAIISRLSPKTDAEKEE